MQGVFDEAEKRDLKSTRNIKWDGGPTNGEQLEVWSAFRRLVKDREAKKPVSSKKLDKIFEACRNHLLSITDICVSTNGNAKCVEIKAWAIPDEGKQKPKFMGVLCDEVGKELEINVWNVVTADLPRRPDMIVFFGDERYVDFHGKASDLYADSTSDSLLL